MVNARSDRAGPGWGTLRRAWDAGAVETRRFGVQGMTCDHCVRAITAEVGAVPGISEVVVDLEEASLTVTGVSIDEAAIVAAVDEAGYTIA